MTEPSTPTQGDVTKESIIAAFAARLAIYDRKRAEAFEEKHERTYGRFEAVQYVIEAIELVALEAGLGHIEREDLTDQEARKEGLIP
jgi:hypothetical protein